MPRNGRTYNVRVLCGGDLVQNVIGSGRFGNAGDLWERGVRYAIEAHEIPRNSRWPRKCCIRYCRNDAEDGGHVWIGAFSGWYIVPVCHNPHNLSGNHPTLGGQENEVVDGTIAVEDDRPEWLDYIMSFWDRIKFSMS